MKSEKEVQQILDQHISYAEEQINSTAKRTSEDKSHWKGRLIEAKKLKEQILELPKEVEKPKSKSEIKNLLEPSDGIKPSGIW